MDFLAFIGMISAIALMIYMTVQSIQSLRAQRKAIEISEKCINQNNELMIQNEKIIKLSKITAQLKRGSMIQEKEHAEILKQVNEKLEKILTKLETHERTHL